MFLKILKMILYFFVIFAKPVYADNFDNTIDSVDNQYIQTIAFSVNGYPNIQNILYERSIFLGENTNLILNSNIGNYVDFDMIRRIPMVADHIDAPPGTQVDIVYLYRNSTGHEVNISKIDWVLSRNIKENGSLTDVIDIYDFAQGNRSYKYSTQNLVKSGIYKEYAGMGIVANGGGGAYVLESVNVSNPLHIDDVKAISNVQTGDIDFEIYIQNNSNEYLNSLKFVYGAYEKIFNIPAKQEYVMSFSIPNTDLELGTFSIYNPNIKQVCAVYGSSYYTYNQTDAIPVLGYREGGIVPGAPVQPVRESFCIKRIPYTMISDEIGLSTKQVIEEVASQSAHEEILGISDIGLGNMLPKTGKGGWGLLCLLVVDVLLWYSVYILRRRYESKNTNSRIRTKSK